MYLRHKILRTPVTKYAMYFGVATALVLPIGTSTQTSLTMMQTANALPAGFFFLELASGVGVMDVEDSNQRVTGFVQFRAPTNRDSQLWKERFPRVGSIDVIRLENKLTGQCLAMSSTDDATARIRPCADEETLWQKIPQGRPNRVVFRRTIPISGPFAPDAHTCPGRHPLDPAATAVVSTLFCHGDTFHSSVVWQATLSPQGSTSAPLTVATPPGAPTGCKLFGTGGTCGLVGFNCDPFSSVDEIVVKSGDIGVTVTGVEPRIGLINGTYLNEGTASVAVCAWRGGMSSCGNPIPDVTIGPTVCFHRPAPPRDCPPGEGRCAGACRPLGLCDHPR
jgi:hypothetical protein